MRFRHRVRVLLIGGLAAVGLGASPLLGTASAAGLSLTVSSGRLQLHLFPTRERAGDFGIGIGSNGAGPLLYGGGPIQKTPKVYLTYWGWHGSDPAAERAYIERFFGGVGGSGWANIQTQYTGTGQGSITNPTGQLAGTWADDATTPLPVITDQQIADEAVRSEQHFGFSADADYFVLTPSGTGTVGFRAVYCAWHSATNDGSKVVAFTNLPYQTDAGSSCGQNFVNSGSAGTLDGVSIVGGHEYAEAVTDPQPSSGWVDATGQENGDKCAWISSGSGRARNISLSSGQFAVQTLWSNAASLVGDCVITYP
jgi:serine protease